MEQIMLKNALKFKNWAFSGAYDSYRYQRMPPECHILLLYLPKTIGLERRN